MRRAIEPAGVAGKTKDRFGPLSDASIDTQVYRWTPGIGARASMF
jgi:hypothetical protein